MRKEVMLCDGCGRILKERDQIYHLDFKIDGFWSGAEMAEKIVRLDFCERCARMIKEIAKRLEAEEKP